MDYNMFLTTFHFGITGLFVFVLILSGAHNADVSPTLSLAVEDNTTTVYFITIKITNRTYSAALRDTNSTYYKELREEVELMFQNAFSGHGVNVTYQGVTQITFSNGSVIANSTTLFGTREIDPTVVKEYLAQGNSSLDLERDFTKVLAEPRSDVDPSPVPISSTTTPLTISPHVWTNASSPTENTVSNTAMTTAPTTVGAPPISSTKGPQHSDDTFTTELKPSSSSVDFSTTLPVQTTSIVNTDISNMTTMLVSTTTNGTNNETTESSTTTAVMNTSISPSQPINTSPTKEVFNTTLPGPTEDTTTLNTRHTDQTFNTTLPTGQTLNTTVSTPAVRTDETTSNSSITPNPLPNSSTKQPDIPLTTPRHRQPTNESAESPASVPGWGIALLVLAALMLLILLIFLIFLIYFCCCQSRGRGFMTVSDPAPYMPFNPDIPMYSTHTTIDLPNGKTNNTDDSAKNRSGMYVVNPSAK